MTDDLPDRDIVEEFLSKHQPFDPDDPSDKLRLELTLRQFDINFRMYDEVAKARSQDLQTVLLLRVLDYMSQLLHQLDVIFAIAQALGSRDDTLTDTDPGFDPPWKPDPDEDDEPWKP